MKCLATAGSFLLLCTLATPTQASLIANGSFETVPNGSTGQGQIPTGWFHTNPSSPASSRANTYSNDGSYGLDPGEGGDFSGVMAAAGIRWVAGQSHDYHGSSSVIVEGEAFGTELTELLVPATNSKQSSFAKGLDRSMERSMPADTNCFCQQARLGPMRPCWER